MLKLALAFAIVALVALLLAAASSGCSSTPTRRSTRGRSSTACSTKTFFVTAADGSRLHGWWLPARARRSAACCTCTQRGEHR